MKFVILTSKPGQFRTELGDDLRQVEAYDYIAQGRNRARFVIAEVTRESKVRIVEEGGAENADPVVNNVPSKFFPSFDSLDKARHELGQLTGGANTALVKL